MIEGRLAEARHDVSVARALWSDEVERINAINTRRDTLIRDEVRFLAYVRPRTVDLVRRSAPAWRLESGDALATIPRVSSVTTSRRTSCGLTCNSCGRLPRRGSLRSRRG